MYIILMFNGPIRTHNDVKHMHTWH